MHCISHMNNKLFPMAASSFIISAFVIPSFKWPRSCPELCKLNAVSVLQPCCCFSSVLSNHSDVWTRAWELGWEGDRWNKHTHTHACIYSKQNLANVSCLTPVLINIKTCCWVHTRDIYIRITAMQLTVYSKYLNNFHFIQHCVIIMLTRCYRNVALLYIN